MSYNNKAHEGLILHLHVSAAYVTPGGLLLTWINFNLNMEK